MPRPAQRLQLTLSIDKVVHTDCVCSGVPLAGSDRHAGWQCLRHKFIGAMPSGLSLRGPNGAVAISQHPAGSQGTPGEYGNFTRRGVEDTAPYKGGCRTRVPSRDCHVASLLAMTRQGNARCTSALLPLNIPYKAVTPRKGDAASVRRQSRQRLRSDRRYRRNRFLRFYRHLVRTGSAFPRLPRRFAPRNDNSEVHTILTMACTDRQHCAGRGMPLPYNARLAALRKIPRSAFHVFFHKFSLSCA